MTARRPTWPRLAVSPPHGTTIVRMAARRTWRRAGGRVGTVARPAPSASTDEEPRKRSAMVAPVDHARRLAERVRQLRNGGQQTHRYVQHPRRRQQAASTSCRRRARPGAAAGGTTQARRALAGEYRDIRGLRPLRFVNAIWDTLPPVSGTIARRDACRPVWQGGRRTLHPLFDSTEPATGIRRPRGARLGRGGPTRCAA